MSRRTVASVLTAVLVSAFVGGGVASAGDADRESALLDRATVAEEQARDHLAGLRRATSREEKLKRDLRSRDTKISALEGQVAQLDEREAALNAREEGLNERQADLDARQSELDGRSASLDAREQEVRGAEELKRRSTIPGDGTFLVGEEIIPGRYRSPGPSSGSLFCYHARLSSVSATGIEGIIENDNSQGPVVVDVKAGDEALEVSGCRPFEKVG